MKMDKTLTLTINFDFLFHNIIIIGITSVFEALVNLFS